MLTLPVFVLKFVPCVAFVLCRHGLLWCTSFVFCVVFDIDCMVLGTTVRFGSSADYRRRDSDEIGENDLFHRGDR